MDRCRVVETICPAHRPIKPPALRYIPTSISKLTKFWTLCDVWSLDGLLSFLHDRPDWINHYDGVAGYTKEFRFILMSKLGILSTVIRNGCTLSGLALYDTIIDGTLEEAGLFGEVGIYRKQRNEQVVFSPSRLFIVAPLRVSFEPIGMVVAVWWSEAAPFGDRIDCHEE